MIEIKSVYKLAFNLDVSGGARQFTYYEFGFSPTPDEVIEFLKTFLNKESSLDKHLRIHTYIWMIYKYGLPEFSSEKWDIIKCENNATIHATKSKFCTKIENPDLVLLRG